jgi:hypothetical protein
MEKLTPKEKAEELVSKMRRDNEMPYQYAKQCALIAINDILNNFGRATEGKQHYTDYNTIEFYTKVKHEIEHL